MRNLNQNNSIKLIKPDISYKESYVGATLEFSEEDGKGINSIEQARVEFDKYFQTLSDHEKGFGLPLQFDKEFFFWLIDGEEFIGRAVIRHRVIEQGLHNGWHLGYSIRPQKRQQGYGTFALELGLEKAKEMGIKKLYLVCDNDNIPSKKILENAGCHFEGEVLRAKPNGKDRFEYSLELI